jgi:TetR/AcrR family transcriptional regulator, lmrAB and yxaGH operons repressor
MSRMPTEPSTTRDRLLAAMTDALQRRGLHGVGLTELLQTAQAPKGVLYHHFPGGKTELAVAAIDQAVAEIDAGLQRLLQRPGEPLNALRQWLDRAAQHLQRSGFERGCPLAAVALESTAEDEAIRLALARGFAMLRERLTQVLSQAGVAAARAPGLAALAVSAYEGALMQARVAGNVQALQATTDTLLALVAREIERPSR